MIGAIRNVALAEKNVLYWIEQVTDEEVKMNLKQHFEAYKELAYEAALEGRND